MKKTLITIIVLAVIAGSVGAYYKFRTTDDAPKVSTLPVSRGDVVEVVGASGTLQTVNKVQIGSQVSGTIKALHADFNDFVRAGQVIAELDPSLIQTQIEQGKANLVRAQADLDRLKVTAEDARVKLKRTQELADKKLVAPQELEAAQLAVRSADSQIKSSEASYVQAQASLNQTQVNLEHCIITTPINGIVINRAVEVGQTVAASMNAPLLFEVAADLTKLQVIASIDESDVGRMRPGQVVRFRVDAYPGDEFTGTVAQVRLQPITVQNVVTYNTVINVPNPDYKLKPGMTANVSIEIARKNDVLRVPNAAIRFRPNADIFQALNLPVPPELQRGQGGQRVQGGQNGSGQGTRGNGQRGAAAPVGGQNAAPAAPATGATATQPPGQQADASAGGNRQGRRGGDQAGQGADRAGNRSGNRTPGEESAGGGRGGDRGAGGATAEERRQRMQERLAAMTPEQRQAFQERMRSGRGGDPAATGGRQGRGDQPASDGQTAAARTLAVNPAAVQTIDAMFGPLPPTESTGRVWMWVGGELKSVRVRLGVTDGTYTELLSGELQAGQELVTQIVTPAAAQAASTRSPLMPGGPGQRGGGPGGFGGGGAPRGGGGR